MVRIMFWIIIHVIDLVVCMDMQDMEIYGYLVVVALAGWNSDRMMAHGDMCAVGVFITVMLQ